MSELFPAQETNAIRPQSGAQAGNISANPWISTPIPIACAVTTCVPGVGPRVQIPDRADPLESVRAEEPSMLPPPEVTVNATGTPATRLLNASLTSAYRRPGRAVPTRPYGPWSIREAI